jgi:hypothetical protein
VIVTAFEPAGVAFGEPAGAAVGLAAVDPHAPALSVADRQSTVSRRLRGSRTRSVSLDPQLGGDGVGDCQHPYMIGHNALH